MFEMTYDEQATLRSPGARSADGTCQYVIVRDEAEDPVILRCKIDRRVRRSVSREGKEIVSDATAAFRGDVTPGSLVRVGWLLVDASQRPYRVAEIETNLILGKTYARVILTACRENVEIAE